MNIEGLGHFFTTYIFQVVYVLCFNRPIYQVSVYRTLVLWFIGASEVGFFFMFISFLGQNHVSKPYIPRWDAAFCGITSGAILFAYVP